MRNSRIEWTDHTFNPWWGCTKVSEGCANCYALTLDKRVGGDHWGPGKPRRTFGAAHWREPLKWNREAILAGERRRVFCASMADVFDAEAPEGALERLWALIRETPHLDWLLLTKRPERIAQSLPPDWGAAGYANVWLGTSAENQQRADERIPHLLHVPARVHFLSCEPLLGPLDLRHWLDVQERIRCAGPHGCGHEDWDMRFWTTNTGRCPACGKRDSFDPIGATSIDWIIVGGESGPRARPMHPTWVRALRTQATMADTSFFFKQWGEWAPADAFSDAPFHLQNGVRWVALDGHHCNGPDARSHDAEMVFRIGKKRAGRHLDGELHDAAPVGASA